MIRYSVVKMGEKLEAIKEVGGQAEWSRESGKENQKWKSFMG